MTGLRQEDLVNQDLITKLRKEFYMTSNDFYMVLTDTDMRAKVGFVSLSLFFSLSLCLTRCALFSNLAHRIVGVRTFGPFRLELKSSTRPNHLAK